MENSRLPDSSRSRLDSVEQLKARLRRGLLFPGQLQLAASLGHSSASALFNHKAPNSSNLAEFVYDLCAWGPAVEIQLIDTLCFFYSRLLERKLAHYGQPSLDLQISSKRLKGIIEALKVHDDLANFYAIHYFDREFDGLQRQVWPWIFSQTRHIQDEVETQAQAVMDLGGYLVKAEICSEAYSVETNESYRPIGGWFRRASELHRAFEYFEDAFSVDFSTAKESVSNHLLQWLWSEPRPDLHYDKSQLARSRVALCHDNFRSKQYAHDLFPARPEWTFYVLPQRNYPFEHWPDTTNECSILWVRQADAVKVYLIQTQSPLQSKIEILRSDQPTHSIEATVQIFNTETEPLSESQICEYLVLLDTTITEADLNSRGDHFTDTLS